MAGFERINKHEKDSIILDWYRFAEAMRYGRRQVWYCLPYDGTWCEDMEDVLNTARGHKLCTKGLCLVMGIRNERFQSIRHASIKGIIPPHKAVGKRGNRAIKNDDPRMIHLKDNFKYLHKLAEDRAVKVTKTAVDGEGGHANRMDTEGNVYLPIHMGYRNRYYLYMELLGYKVTVGPHRSLTVDKEDAANANCEQDFVTFSTYWSKWKILYPHMKVSRPAEDICSYCYTFANKHRILSSRQSAMQQQQETTHAVDCNDENEFDEMMKNLSLDTPGAACTEIEEAKEILIRDCARHINMARAQRLLYQRLEEAAVGNARDGVEHNKQRYTLTCDFGQIMQCPCYNSKQPGCTYYYTPLNVFNFGVVDHSHD